MATAYVISPFLCGGTNCHGSDYVERCHTSHEHIRVVGDPRYGTKMVAVSMFKDRAKMSVTAVESNTCK